MLKAQHRGNDSELIEMGCQMLDWMWARGWDSENGGIFFVIYSINLFRSIGTT